MAWNLSTGLAKAILKHDIATLGTPYIGNDVTFTTNSLSITNTFNGIEDDHFIFIIRHGGGGNNNKLLQCITATNNQLTFANNTLTTEAAGTYHCIIAVDFGSIQGIMQNGVLRLYTGSRPADADQAETGTLLAEITKDGASFTANTPTNGLNVGDFDGSTMKRMTDPSTGSREVWQGTGQNNGTAAWGRWYANPRETGASTTAIRMDGVVSTAGGSDIVMAAGRDIVSGATVTVTEVSITAAGM